ncbi:NAD-dependent epimerase/dehydratase family protein [Rhodobacter capsulatus]|uniref:NAD-dependent epimerase/dehydratase family protein n=1 Tax=Rhodobacter capsulatus (strain ATCC BAA-309 / NBRC 16581 / SB1003) TaxID=272942 RepID=D5ARE4_RHOCB|nr:NAD-dependent epimerase/dehydratase family protein [Rhodobacter capsulatus]ADE86949.1 NAD-dependent epimerase/dehydratase family protein [Rhodobacter capsulatus SB 1003]ETD00479.1 NAD-dependent epimerase [Rhodobacter capsulatus DE442]ETD74819.1 NAD-dependent epimerase [Rhodobacter capsulatus R121]ETE52385.1 NAD-dependent epimerase [Rhodobacter capsulatus Y262]MDS0928748.1 NAD-dependent epimerase/dehydratase family protein [Rhodobacter capsulatus]
MRSFTSNLKPEFPRLLVLGGSGRLGGLLRRVWSLPGTAAPPLVWQARRPGDFAAFGGPTVVFDPLAAPEALVRAVRAAEAVLLLAGPTRGTAAEMAAHRDLAAAVLDCAGGRPVLLASSAAVYGRPAGPLCAEEDAPAPVSDYGRAKVAMEAVAAGRPGAVVLRIGNVAGADALLGQPAPPGGRRLHVFPDGLAPRRSYIGPQALARGLARLVRLAASGAALPGVINLALPGVVGMEALLRAAGESWQADPAPPGAIATVELAVARALALDLVPDLPVTAAGLIADLRLEEGRA